MGGNTEPAGGLGLIQEKLWCPERKEGCVSKRGTPGQHRHAERVQPSGARVFEQAVIRV